MTEKFLLLPFIVEARGEKESVSYPAELAGVVFLTEFQRGKKGFLRDKTEKTSFISKLYYPLRVLPLEDSCLIIDGLASLSHNFAFKEPTNTRLFVEDLKKNSVVAQEFIVALTNQAKNTEKFTSTINLSFEALIADKELLKFFLKHLERSLPFSGGKTVFVPSAIDESKAVAVGEAVTNCLRRIYGNVRGLQYALEVLNQEVEFHERMILNEVELLKEKCKTEASNLQPEMEKTIGQLKLQHDKVATRVWKDTEKKAAALEKKQEKFLRKLQELERRKEALLKKRGTTRRAYQTYSLEKYDRGINDTKKEIRANASLIENIRKTGNKSIKKIEEEFRGAVALEEAKIKKLNSEYEVKIGEKKKQFVVMASETAAITKSFTSLMEEAKQAASAFREQITINWKVDDPTVICVPIYMAGYVKDGKERYTLFSPMTISEDVSVLQGLRKVLTLTPVPRLKLLMRSVSNELHEMLSSSVIKKMQTDETFRQNLTSLCRANNLLGREDFERTLNKGLTEAEQKYWLTAEEATTVRSGIKGEET